MFFVFRDTKDTLGGKGNAPFVDLNMLYGSDFLLWNLFAYYSLVVAYLQLFVC